VWCLIILKDVFTHGYIRDKQLIKQNVLIVEMCIAAQATLKQTSCS